MSWTGNLIVTKSTEHSITDVSVTHTCGEFIDSASAATLASNTSTAPIKMRGQSGHDDLWNVSFKLNGETIGRSGKQCNFEQEDAGKTIYILLHESNFSIVCPESDSCVDNHY